MKVPTDFLMALKLQHVTASLLDDNFRWEMEESQELNGRQITFPQLEATPKSEGLAQKKRNPRTEPGWPTRREQRPAQRGRHCRGSSLRVTGNLVQRSQSSPTFH